ncbi:MAG TPA: hypothetical protein VFQ30_14345 [Ktedonobacteraceae bacterium]|nr:hypothetical protein [Ktedonobacteraceae bacterium]
MDSTRMVLLQSLALTISDYQQNKIAPINSAHIEKWLNQFDLADQPIILAEIDSIMKRYYFSRTRVKEAIRAFLKETIIRGNDFRQVLPHICFLNIQKIGSSQGAMLDLTDEILQEDYNWSTSMTATQEVDTYIYMDDCIYTGSRIRYDLTDGTDSSGWLSNCPSSNCVLYIFTIATHTEGMSYASKRISDATQNKQIRVRWKPAFMINNHHRQGNSIEVLWPEGSQDVYVASYVSELEMSLSQAGRSTDVLRKVSSSQERLFSSLQARRVVEQAFLKKGIQLVKASKNAALSIRPLGFMKLVSLGFGTLFVTYRNIANNCPLVLWWGDPNLPSTHPIGQWYPLFPRLTNVQRDIIVAEQIFDEPF